jgi:hypothetical protein
VAGLVALGVELPGVFVPGVVVAVGGVAPVGVAAGVLAPGDAVAFGTVTAAGVLTVILAGGALERELPVSWTRAAASTPSDRAATTASAMIGALQVGDVARRVRAAPPHRRHHSCSGSSAEPHNGQTSSTGAGTVARAPLVEPDPPPAEPEPPLVEPEPPLVEPGASSPEPEAMPLEPEAMPLEPEAMPLEPDVPPTRRCVPPSSGLCAPVLGGVAPMLTRSPQEDGGSRWARLRQAPPGAPSRAWTTTRPNVGRWPAQGRSVARCPTCGFEQGCPRQQPSRPRLGRRHYHSRPKPGHRRRGRWRRCWRRLGLRPGRWRSAGRRVGSSAVRSWGRSGLRRYGLRHSAGTR